MKSSYELALERLNKSDPQAVAPLSAKQKEQMAEIDRRCRAKIAEKELFLKPKIERAQLDGDQEGAGSMEKQLRDETRLLREELEQEKEKIRQGASRSD